MSPNPLPFAIALAIIVFSISVSVVYFERDRHKRNIESIDVRIRFLQQGIKSIGFGMGSVVVFYNVDENDQPVFQRFDPPPQVLQMALASADQFKLKDKSGERTIDKDSPHGLAQILIAASLSDHGWGAKTIFSMREANDKEILTNDQWRKATNWLQAEHGIQKDTTSTRCGNAPGKSCLGEVAQVVGIKFSPTPSESPTNSVFTQHTTATRSTQQQRGSEK